MKKLKNISMIAFFLTVVSVGAMEIEKDGISVNGDQTLVIELAKVNAGTLIFFEDNEGDILFKDNLLKDGKYNKTLHLEMIPEGVYYLKVEKRFAIRVWKIEKYSNGIEISDNSSTVTFKPHFRKQADLVQVYMANHAENKIALTVEDKKGEVLVSLAEKSKDFRKDLDFSSLPPGEYYIKVSNGKEKFEEKVDIN